MIPLWVVIPTFNRCDLLERTLDSLARASMPACVQTVIVAENGPASGAEAIAARFALCLPIQYRFSPMPNKSRALNAILSEMSDQFIVFFDDDVRLDANVLSAYEKTVSKFGPRHFFGGRCLVDYEQAPPEWLKKALPPSVQGWAPGDQIARLNGPEALGCNWGAFASDLKACGGFDETRGPGTNARGQEWAMQGKLLSNGVVGYYLPDAIVWHFVPKERCSLDWCLERTVQNWTGQGMDLARKDPRSRFRRRRLKMIFRVAHLKTKLGLFGFMMSDERKFRYRVEACRLRGTLRGINAFRKTSATTQLSPP